MGTYVKEAWRSVYPGVGEHVLVERGSISLSKSLFEDLSLSLIILVLQFCAARWGTEHFDARDRSSGGPREWSVHVVKPKYSSSSAATV